MFTWRRLAALESRRICGGRHAIAQRGQPVGKIVEIGPFREANRDRWQLWQSLPLAIPVIAQITPEIINRTAHRML